MITETAFSEETQDTLYTIEDTSWWFKYRASVINFMVKNYMDYSKEIVDLGGGNGFTTYFLQKNGWNMHLIEPSEAACRNAKCRGVKKVTCGLITNDSIRDEKIFQLLLLDVLEHIEDDREFLKNIYNKMEKGGYILITVPAFHSLWSSEDNKAGHFRRYTIQEIVSLARKEGFNVILCNYFFSFLYIPVYIMRVLGERLKIVKRREDRDAKEQEKINRIQFKEKKGIVNFVLSILERVEIKNLKSNKRQLFGSSIICILKK